MKLIETTDLMESAEYKDRFRAEYYQTVIRYKKLKKLLRDWDDDKLDFKPTCPRVLYTIQLKAMADYIAILETRSHMEGIMLADVEAE